MVPDHYRGRVMSGYSMVLIGISPAGCDGGGVRGRAHRALADAAGGGDGLSGVGRVVRDVGFASLLQWGDRWIYGEAHEPLLVIDRRSGRRIPRLRLLDEEGRPLALRDIALVAGPGANKRTRARYRAT
jgi:hypothetical protein